MKNIWIAFIGLAIFLTIAVSCNKTSLVGAELFENDKLNLQFTDTLTINALNDAPLPYVMSLRNATSYDFLPLGNVNDAYFGKSEAAIYSKFGNKNIAAPYFPKGDTTIIDSIRLILPYSVANIYGDTMATQKLVVYRLTEELKGDTIYSDKTFANAATPLGSVIFKPEPTTAIRRIVGPANTRAIRSDTFTDAPHVSIALDINFGRTIIGLDSASTYKDTLNSGFDFWLKGLVIKAETPANCMLNFNMGVTSTATTGQISRPAGIYVYYRYKYNDTLRQVYVYSPASLQRYSNIKNDYQSGKIKDYVGANPKADSLIFLQSLGGSVARFEIPNLKKLGNIAINRAELEFTINETNDITTFPAVSQLSCLSGTAKLANGNLGNTGTAASQILNLLPFNVDGIADVGQQGSTANFATSSDFGGFPTTENGVRKYKMSFTSHLQRITAGTVGTQFYLAPHLQYTRGGRVVLYSPKSPRNKAKLNLYYTKL